ncbi:hypothetical protein [Streptomyces zaomyceticus]|uniref:hypothetical protein n=1 Tax=Streptomyces zaomyceticus TaxID=68286 RepID=UPI001E56E899|nr:hypothetical protein [Streptomyces zaomyceticus]
MRDTYGRALRTGAVVAAGMALLAACSPGDGGGDGKPPRSTPSTSASGTPTPSPTASGRVVTLDPKKAPRTAAEAKRLALAVVAGPDAWGPEYVERSPFLSAPGSWPVLDEQCTWEAGSLPGSVLYSVTSYSEIPAAGGKGVVRVAATVTIHRTGSDAGWEMAETLEEALRCTDQRLSEGERISGLTSVSPPYDEHSTTDDLIVERGSYLNDAFEKPQFYTWFQTRIGQVSFATVIKGAPGYTEANITDAQVRANVIMQDRVKKQWGAQS